MNDLRITFRHVLPTDSLREFVGLECTGLEGQLGSDLHCQLLVERLTPGHAHGALIRARVLLKGPGVDVVAEGSSADAEGAIRMALHHATQRVRKVRTKATRVRRQRRDTMMRPHVLHGW